MSPGYKTTEFWICLFILLTGVFVSAGVVGPNHVSIRGIGLVMQVLAAFGYTMARAKTKFGNSLKEAEEFKATLPPTPGS